MSTQRFIAICRSRPRGGVVIEVPFDPNDVWGERERHHITGTVGGCRVRGPLVRLASGYAFELGPAFTRDNPVAPGDEVDVELAPEGPQLGSLHPEFAAALATEPQALQFFEALPTFYRKNFVRWIDSAKRDETRTRRIVETVAALKDGRRER